MQFIPTPLALVSWLCTFRGWLFANSLVMCILYFVVAYLLRSVVFELLKTLFESFVTYNLLKRILVEYVVLVKTTFYISLGYSMVGFCGAVGAIFIFEPFLWVYFAYLAVTFGLNIWQMIKRLNTLFDVANSLKPACNLITLGFGDCEGKLSSVKMYLIAGAAVILFFQSILLICCIVILRRARREAKKKEKKHSGSDSQPEMSENNSLGKPMRRSRRAVEWSSDEDTFDLPRRRATTGEDEEEEKEDLPALPEGRRRRGVEPSRRSQALSGEGSGTGEGKEETWELKRRR